MSESPKDIVPEAVHLIQSIRWSVDLVSRHTRWESKCLVQALTAQFMLKRRDIPSTLYLGMAKDGSNKLIAHAWLKCGELYVTGEDARKMFKEIARFTN